MFVILILSLLLWLHENRTIVDGNLKKTLVMLKKFQAYLYHLWNDKPLGLILVIAIVLRMVSVVFSKGYEMHDDHYLVVEAPQSWVDGRDYDNWLPWNQENPKPDGHSFFYIGFQFLFLYVLKYIGITDPQFKMFLVRLIHAIFSILIVSLGYRITEKIAGKRPARLTGLLLAIYWFMPFFSVRNLVEIVCIPFMMAGIWMIINADSKKNPLAWFLLAGFVSGMAFSVRYQTSVFLAGIGLALLLKKEIIPAITFSLGTIISVIIFQGIPDLVIWGYPFAEFIEYSAYNVAHRNQYITGSWYNYLAVLAGMLLPPFSLLLFWGFVRTWKKHLLIFLPALIFIVFHSSFPNKQERFIFPVIPFFIILGVIGWMEYYDKSSFWQKNKLFYRVIIMLFWLLNIPLLLLFTPSYAKKSRVESMTYLSSSKNISFILIEDSNHRPVIRLPRFYLGQWPSFYEYAKPQEDLSGCNNISVPGQQYIHLYSLDCLKQISNDSLPDFVIFIDKVNLDERVKKMSRYLPHLKFLKEIRPGFRDKIMYVPTEYDA